MDATVQNEKKSKGLPKAAGILIGIAVAFAFLAIIIFHNNPLAVQKEEWIKKAIAIGMVLVSLTAFITLYDKIVVLPKELWVNRELIWKHARNDFK